MYTLLESETYILHILNHQICFPRYRLFAKDFYRTYKPSCSCASVLIFVHKNYAITDCSLMANRSAFKKILP